MKQLILSICICFLVIASVVIISGNKEPEEKKLNNIPEEVCIVDAKAVPVNAPDKAVFAGEEVPLHDQDVRERLERELLNNTYWHSNTLLLLKRANRYFPTIEKVLREEGVPEDFKYLALAESKLFNVISPRDARGVWQFLESTATQYRLKINDEVDERYHLEKSTAAAAKYLKDQHDKFGSWALAAAAYNAGRYGVLKQLENQQVDSYYDLYLNTQTARYVFRLIAFKEIFENPEKYGFFLEEKDLYQPLDYSVVKVTEPIRNLAAYAKEQGTTYKYLKIMNPWLRTTHLTPGKGETYELKIHKTH